jgi:hypothetical protein
MAPIAEQLRWRTVGVCFSPIVQAPATPVQYVNHKDHKGHVGSVRHSLDQVCGHQRMPSARSSSAFHPLWSLSPLWFVLPHGVGVQEFEIRDSESSQTRSQLSVRTPPAENCACPLAAAGTAPKQSPGCPLFASRDRKRNHTLTAPGCEGRGQPPGPFGIEIGDEPSGRPFASSLDCRFLIVSRGGTPGPSLRRSPVTIRSSFGRRINPLEGDFQKMPAESTAGSRCRRTTPRR